MRKLFCDILIISLCFCGATSCIIHDNEKTDLVLSFGVDETFDFEVKGTFDKTTLITRTQIVAGVDIPAEATVKKVDIEYIAAKIEPLAAHISSGAINLNATFGSQALFNNKSISYGPEMEVINGLNPATVKAFRTQLLNYFDDDYANDDDIIFNLNGSTNPPGDTVEVRVKMRLQGAVTISTTLL